MSYFVNQKGLSLLEVILTLAIISSVIVLGVRLYQGLSMDANVQKIKANIDQLFFGMQHYYRANCRGGKLDPTVSAPAVGSVLNLSITDDLITPGHLKDWKALNPLISAYSVQFRRLPDSTTNLFTCTNYTSLNCNPPQNISGSVVVRYYAEVLVTPRNAAQVNTLKLLLGSTACSSTYAPPPTYTPVSSTACSGNNISNVAIVFTRAPLASVPLTTSRWLYNPNINQFNMQYYNDSFAALNNITWSNSQYYLCGG